MRDLGTLARKTVEPRQSEGEPPLKTGTTTADRMAAANARAVERLTAAEPVLIDVRPAGEVVPGLTRETILTSGPPLAWADYRGGQRNAIVGAAGLVRYRARVADPKDAGVMLVTLAVGLTVGSGLYGFAVLACVFVMALLWVLESFEPPARSRFELTIGGKDAGRLQPEIEHALQQKSVTYELLGSSAHELHGASCAAPTSPTAAMRWGSLHERMKLIPPPFDSPFA